MPEPCDVQPRLQFTGTGPPSIQGDLCRIAARVTYLEDILACEESTDPDPDPECCEKAYNKYVSAHNACPD